MCCYVVAVSAFLVIINYGIKLGLPFELNLLLCCPKSFCDLLDMSRLQWKFRADYNAGDEQIIIEDLDLKLFSFLIFSKCSGC